jgi:chitin synthase
MSGRQQYVSRPSLYHRSIEYLEKMGMYNSDEGHAALDNSSDIRMHLFETTLMIQSDAINAINERLQSMFALKEHDGGKLDSHHRFFNAFSSQLRPKYCIVRRQYYVLH